MQNLTFIIFIVSEKIATLKVLPHTDNLTFIITYSHFSCDSKIHFFQTANTQNIKPQTTESHCFHTMAPSYKHYIQLNTVLWR